MSSCGSHYNYSHSNLMLELSWFKTWSSSRPSSIEKHARRGGLFSVVERAYNRRFLRGNSEVSIDLRAADDMKVVSSLTKPPSSSTRPCSNTPSLASRVVGIDYLKALAILAVIWIHSFMPFDLSPPALRLMFILGEITHFAVPTFFFASGFLYFSKAPIPWPTTVRRLKRILIPYLIVSILAEAFMSSMTELSLSASMVFFDVATGKSFPIFYFIPVLLLLVLIIDGRALSRVPRAVFPLFLVLVTTGLLSVMHYLPMSHFWLMRNPLNWGCYFFFGWLVRERWATIEAWPASKRLGFGAVCAAAIIIEIIFLSYQPDHSWKREVAAVSYFGSYFMILGILLMFNDAVPIKLIRWLSDRTYGLYLYHFFFVFFVLTYHLRTTRMTGFIALAAGLAGSVLICLSTQKLMGRERSRRYFGA